MKGLLLATGVLGLAAVFAMSEPSFATGKQVTSGDVQLLTEQMPEQPSQSVGRQRNGKNGKVTRYVR